MKTVEIKPVVTLTTLAAAIGARTRQLQYLIRVGKVPPGIKEPGGDITYTPDEAQQIAAWWRLRRKLVFK